MAAWVVDASVALKWMLPEDLTDQALAVAQGSMLAPSLLQAEVANVLATKFRRGETSMYVVRSHMTRLNLLGIEFAELGGLTLPALEIAAALRHPIYDCYYLALAAREGTQVVTADDRLVRVSATSPLYAGLVRPLAGFA